MLPDPGSLLTRVGGLLVIPRRFREMRWWYLATASLPLGMPATFPPAQVPVKGRAWLVAGDLAGIGSPQNLGDLVLDADVDL
jgi:hypothetical protein